MNPPAQRQRTTGSNGFSPLKGVAALLGKVLPESWLARILVATALSLGLAVLLYAFIAPVSQLLARAHPQAALLAPGLVLGGLSLLIAAGGFRVKLIARTQPNFQFSAQENLWKTVGKITGCGLLFLWGIGLWLGLDSPTPGLARASHQMGRGGLWAISGLIQAGTFYLAWKFLTRPKGMLSAHPERTGRLRTISALLVGLLGLIVLL